MPAGGAAVPRAANSCLLYCLLTTDAHYITAAAYFEARKTRSRPGPAFGGAFDPLPCIADSDSAQRAFGSGIRGRRIGQWKSRVQVREYLYTAFWFAGWQPLLCTARNTGNGRHGRMLHPVLSGRREGAAKTGIRHAGLPAARAGDRHPCGQVLPRGQGVMRRAVRPAWRDALPRCRSR